MVLGLFEGSIDVTIDRQNYSRNDAVNCSAVLKLKQPTEARGLRATFTRIEGSGKHTYYYELAQKEVAPGRAFRDGERFEFTFLVDEAAAPDIVKFGGLTGSIQTLFGAFGPRSRWLIRAYLDMPMKLDISGKAMPIINRPIVQR